MMRERIGGDTRPSTRACLGWYTALGRVHDRMIEVDGIIDADVVRTLWSGREKLALEALIGVGIVRKSQDRHAYELVLGYMSRIEEIMAQQPGDSAWAPYWTRPTTEERE